MTWLMNRPAWLLLRAEAELPIEAAGRFRGSTALELLALSLLWGVLCCGVWQLGVAMFGDTYNLYLLPSLAVTALSCGWLYKRAVLSLGRRCGDSSPAAASSSSLAATLLVLFWFGGLLSIRPTLPEPDLKLPWALQWLWPYEQPLRVLVLMPLWGAWSMVILPKFCRVRESTEPAVKAFASSCGVMTAALLLAAPLAPTLAYFGFLGPYVAVICGMAVVAGVAGGLLLCRRHGGLCRDVLLQVNLLTQLGMLLGYLWARNLVQWK